MFTVLAAVSFAAEEDEAVAVDSLAPKKTEKRGILGGYGYGHYGHISPYYGGYYDHGYGHGHGIGIGYPYAYTHQHHGYYGHHYPGLYGGHGHFY